MTRDSEGNEIKVGDKVLVSPNKNEEGQRIGSVIWRAEMNFCCGEEYIIRSIKYNTSIKLKNPYTNFYFPPESLTLAENEQEKIDLTNKSKIYI